MIVDLDIQAGTSDLGRSKNRCPPRVMTKKKIIFVNRFFFPDHSATAQILTDLAFDLAAEHRDVLVITTRGLYDDPACVLARWQSINGVEIQRVYRPRFGRNRLLGRAMDYLAMHLSFTLAVAKGARKGDVIVAKTDPPMLSIPFLLIAVIKRAKLINWLQDIYPEVAVAWKAPFSRTVATALTPVRDVSLRRAHKNVVVGERSRAFLRQRGVAEEKIHVVHNWCDDEAMTRPITKPTGCAPSGDWRENSSLPIQAISVARMNAKRSLTRRGDCERRTTLSFSLSAAGRSYRN